MKKQRMLLVRDILGEPIFYSDIVLLVFFILTLIGALTSSTILFRVGLILFIFRAYSDLLIRILSLKK